MLAIHGKMLVRNFRQAVLDTFGIALKVHQGFSMGQTADEDATLAATRSEQAEAIGDSLVLEADMTVEQAKAAIRKAVGFAVQVLDSTGANAPGDAKLSALGFQTVARAPGTGSSGVSVTGQKKLSTLQSEFTGKFPRLGLMFFSLDEARKAEQGATIRPLPSDQTVASVRTKVAKGDLSIHGNTTVGTLEAAFRQDYGLQVQVCVMREGKPVYTGAAVDGVSLTELDRRCQEQSRGAFVYPKS